MAENKFLKGMIRFHLWFLGIIISLIFAFHLIEGVWTIRWIPMGVTALFGWIIIFSTLIITITKIISLFIRK